MAIDAILWRGFVEQDRLALNVALLCMTQRAAHIRVAACQRELSAFVMVKCGRRPALFQMTISALRDSVLGGKLAAVGIRVAAFAILGRALKLNFVGAGKQLVAF